MKSPKSKKKKRHEKDVSAEIIDRIDLDSLMALQRPESLDFNSRQLTEDTLARLLNYKYLAYEPEFKSFYFNPIEVFRILREELRKEKSLNTIDDAQKTEELLEKLTEPTLAQVLDDYVLDKIRARLDDIINRAARSNNLKLFTLADLYLDFIGEAESNKKIASLGFMRALVLKTIMAAIKLNRILIDSFNIGGLEEVDTLDSGATFKIDAILGDEFPDIGTFLMAEIKRTAKPKLLKAVKDGTLKTHIFTSKEVERGYAMLKEEQWKTRRGKVPVKFRTESGEPDTLKILSRFLEIVFTEGRIKKLVYVIRNYVNNPEYRQWKEGFEGLVDANFIGSGMEADLDTLAQIYYYEIRNAYPKDKIFQE